MKNRENIYYLKHDILRHIVENIQKINDDDRRVTNFRHKR